MAEGGGCDVGDELHAEGCGFGGVGCGGMERGQDGEVHEDIERGDEEDGEKDGAGDGALGTADFSSPRK